VICIQFSLLNWFGTGIVISFLYEVATTNVDHYSEALHMLLHPPLLSQQDFMDMKELFRSRGLELTDGRFLEIMDSSALISHCEGTWLYSLADPSAVLMVDAFDVDVNDEVVSTAASSLTPTE
jgi:hypothetical protein